MLLFIYGKKAYIKKIRFKEAIKCMKKLFFKRDDKHEKKNEWL